MKRPKLPFEGKFFTLTGNHLMHYLDEGEGGIPLVMVHGNPTWSYYYRRVVQRFSDRRRCVAMDHIGMGLSSKPQEDIYNLDFHIRNLKEFLDGIGIKKFDLMVHDWGGAIGLGLAVDEPDRVGKIIISNTAAFPSFDIPKRIEWFKRIGLGELLIRRLNLFAWPASIMATKRGLIDVDRDAYLYPYQTYEDRVGVWNFVRDIPIEEKGPTYQRLETIEAGLNNLLGPKLLLWGAKDFCFHPGFLQRWKSIYPKATSVAFPKAGHYVLEDAWDESAQALEKFLTP